MKNALLVFVLLALIAKANCQTAETPPLTKEDYLKRSKNQKIGGFVTLGVGIGLIVGGVTMARNGVMDDSKFENGAVLLVLGVLTTIVSIPILISARKNEKRAASISVSNFKYPVLQQKSIVMINPAITFKVQLNRLYK